MALVVIASPGSTPSSLTDWSAVVAQLSVLLLNRENPIRISGSTILKGALFNVAGTMLIADADTTISGTQTNYVKISVSGSAGTAVFASDLTGVEWDAANNGYYDTSGNLYIFEELKALHAGVITGLKKDAVSVQGLGDDWYGVLAQKAVTGIIDALSNNIMRRYDQESGDILTGIPEYSFHGFYNSTCSGKPNSESGYWRHIYIDGNSALMEITTWYGTKYLAIKTSAAWGSFIQIATSSNILALLSNNIHRRYDQESGSILTAIPAYSFQGYYNSTCSDKPNNESGYWRHTYIDSNSALLEITTWYGSKYQAIKHDGTWSAFVQIPTASTIALDSDSVRNGGLIARTRIVKVSFASGETKNYSAHGISLAKTSHRITSVFAVFNDATDINYPTYIYKIEWDDTNIALSRNDGISSSALDVYVTIYYV